MAVDADSDLARRVKAWFLANDGMMLGIQVGTYADDRDPPERMFLSTATPIEAITDSGTFTDPIVALHLGDERSFFYLGIAPRHLARAIFGKEETDSLKLYFDDGAYVELLA